ncbi:hypothetical protein PN441_07690 [Spirulina major CS-329]|uniref:hypothetical protein n=1 Tax=Spirulina TaxID=1154 RepID=UPI002330B000|nr:MULTISPECIES: hypothetical protein [Spirulina]MDB9495045.1 hypothetical protein [Spirulina subsalsa CS-330]MDB9502951.1 hypothetical protein [Spirulina major CS-329]
MVPKFLNRRFALVTGLAVLGAITFAPKASAQTADVPFNGSVTSTCTFGTPAAGTVTATGDTFTSTASGTVTLTCNSAASTLAIAAPTQVSGPALTATAVTSEVTGTAFNGGTAITNVSPATAAGAILTNDPLVVDMTWKHSANIPGGTYKFNVQLTATPQ